MLFTNPLAATAITTASATSDTSAAAAADSVATFFVASPPPQTVASHQQLQPPPLPPFTSLSHHPRVTSYQQHQSPPPPPILESPFVVDGAAVDGEGMMECGGGFAPMNKAPAGGGGYPTCSMLPAAADAVSSQESPGEFCVFRLPRLPSRPNPISSDFAADPALSMCVNPTDVFAAGVSTATTTSASAAAGNDGDLATLVTGNISAGSDICCKDVVINSGFGRRRSSGARSLVSLPPGMIVDSDMDAGAEEEDILMDEINWDKLL